MKQGKRVSSEAQSSLDISRSIRGEPPGRIYGFIRGRQLEGTFPGDPSVGCWGITARRIMKGWGMTPESAWPYPKSTDPWPPEEPANIDTIAKRDRISAYQLATSLNNCRILLASNWSVGASFRIDDSWRMPEGGVIPAPTLPPNTAHSICLVGYSDEKSHFIFRNSWGTEWGDSGYGYLPYEYFETRFLEGWFVFPIKSGRCEGESEFNRKVFGLRSPLPSMLHCIELSHQPTDEIIAWAFAAEGEKRLDIEELFVRPGWRNRGHGEYLARYLVGLSQGLQKPLRLWISHADIGRIYKPDVERLLSLMNLRLGPSLVSWASAIAA